MIRGVILRGEKFQQLLITTVTNSPYQSGNRHLPFTVYFGRDYIPIAGLKLEPGSAHRDQLSPAQLATTGSICFGGEVNPRGTN